MPLETGTKLGPYEITGAAGAGGMGEVYRATQDFPKEEMYGLISQPRRAAVSVPSNIAEGQGRFSTGDFKQFLGHAKGSRFELQTQAVIAQKLGFMKDKVASKLVALSDEVGRMLSGLLSSLRVREWN